MQQTERDDRLQDEESFADARREFLAKCGRLAIVTPPAVTLMLAASKRNFAVAYSGGGPGGRDNDGDGDDDDGRRPRRSRRANNGFGNGGHDGVPGRSPHSDDVR
jgi:hypothetical protein